MDINVGKLIREAREKQNLTQEELAQKVGKKRSYISRIEGVEGANIKLKTLVHIIEKGFEGKITIEL
ncbi:helix-turn-helix transcriptional regulator [Flavobacterium oreochromis]|uniref:helix-turn-helix domain-containing protein n=1 Tax=Flavobacterium oreochromis TaxID=2906078 RepID=UPI003859156E